MTQIRQDMSWNLGKNYKLDAVTSIGIAFGNQKQNEES